MKKILALVMAGCFVLGSLGTAAAVDVKVKGQWDFSYGYYSNRSMYDADKSPNGKADNFQPRMRARTQIEFIASESLSALLHFEIGDIDFGTSKTGNSGPSSGGALDSDGVNVETKRAHLDWVIPQTSVKVRMGIQGIALPNTGVNLPIMNADVAGVSMSTDFTPEVGLTAFWARPYDKQATDATRNEFDEMDIFGVMVPFKNQVVRVTPWAMAGSVGKDSGYYEAKTWGNGGGRVKPVAADSRESQAFAWWAGMALELPVLDPFYVKFDGAYGQLDAKDDFDSKGYFLASKIGYKWNWGKTGLLGWYSSGDKGGSSDSYGSIPVVSDDTGFTMTPYGLGGQRGINRRGAISDNGIGTWGIGFEVADVSFMKDLSHTFTAAFMRGTNQGDALGSDSRNLYNEAAGAPHYSYLITSDSAWDFSLKNEYQLYPNMTVALDFSYIHLDLSKQRADAQRDTTDSFASMLSFQYKF